MKTTKRLLSLLLAVCAILTVIPAALAAVPFVDVAPDAWYCSDVTNAYEMGLINGKTATTFKPDDNLTYAEAVKLAACMHQRYTTDAVTLQNGNPWYQSYVDYCKINGIISKDYAWEMPATRAGYIEIFANALPAEALAEINAVEDGSIPDVSLMHPQAAAIYKLYRAGILQGNDAERNCNPSASIKRSEVAAILTRMMDASQRVYFTMGNVPEMPKQEEPEKEEPKQDEPEKEEPKQDPPKKEEPEKDPPKQGNDNELPEGYGDPSYEGLGTNDTPIY